MITKLRITLVTWATLAFNYTLGFQLFRVYLTCFVLVHHIACLTCYEKKSNNNYPN